MYTMIPKSNEPSLILFTAQCYASVVYAIVVCVFVFVCQYFQFVKILSLSSLFSGLYKGIHVH